MRTSVLLSALVLGIEQVCAQAVAWGQCGGTGYTGPTTCVSGYTCVYSNTWYSQCVVGSASSATVSSILSTSTSTHTSTPTTQSASNSTSTSVSTTHSKFTSTPTSIASATGQKCTASFTPITASAAYAALNPGWNLGNTLDAIPDEGSWGFTAQASTFTYVKSEGFSSVRIPVTWAYHYSGSSPDWTINSTWMDRVETVVDQALAAGLHVILNMHHDSWIWADVSADGANLTMIEEKFGASWSQIGARFACKSKKLVFEAINEPPGTTQAQADELNKLNGIFLDSINKAGGHNAQRVVSLSGLQMNAALTSQWFVPPTTYTNQPWGLQFHYYSPYDFIFGAWGKTIWGSDADKASLLEDFTLFNGNFTTVPAFVGEWDPSPINTETTARWKYFDYFIKTCNEYKYSSFLWDAGLDYLNRTTGTWNDPVAMDILFKGIKGANNTLADSTTDPSTSSQVANAYLFHKVGDAVIAQSVNYLLNGNTLKSIKNSAGATLTTSQYSMSSTGNLTLTAEYLSTLYTASAAPGIKDTLQLKFSAGASLSLQIVQYDTPTVAQTTYQVDTSADLAIPITYKGVSQVAAVKGLLADGTYLADSWTTYLGPLQQARWTYGSWEIYEETFSILVAGLEVIQATGQNVTLTLEFFPRSVGNNSVDIVFIQ